MLREALPEIVTGSVPGPKAAELLKRRDAAIPKAMCGTTYPICMGRGEGAMLEDVDGNRFLDWIGGVGVLNIGYSNPEVVEAVKAQADKYFHGIFNVYVHEGYVKLAEMFDETMPCRGDKMKTYFANSGAEADENAIKIAKAYTGRNNIINRRLCKHKSVRKILFFVLYQCQCLQGSGFPCCVPDIRNSRHHQVLFSLIHFFLMPAE